MLGDKFELGSRELIALTGGGGKSTLMFRLGRELAGSGKRVLVTTTTKMGPDQMAEVPSVCRSIEINEVNRALDGPGPVMLVAQQLESKILGPPPVVVDELFAAGRLDYLVVEADGSRRRPLKAPAAHEPVVPASATLVIVVMGIDAVGRPLQEVTHRPPEAISVTGLSPVSVLTPSDCARIIGHPEGGLRGIPPEARVAVAITKVTPGAGKESAHELAELLEAHPRIERVVLLGPAA